MQVTFGFLVPPVMLMLAQHPLVSNYNFSSLRRLIVGAAPIAPWTVENALEGLNNPNIITQQGRISLLMLISTSSVEQRSTSLHSHIPFFLTLLISVIHRPTPEIEK